MMERGRDLPRAHADGSIYRGRLGWKCATHLLTLQREGDNLKCPKATCILLIFDPIKETIHDAN